MSLLSINKSTAYFILLCLCFSSCLPFNAFVYIVPDQKDIKRFKHAVVKHADTCFEFSRVHKNKPIIVSNWTYKLPLSQLPLENFLEQQQCCHFMVIKKDSIVFEYNDKKLSTYQPSPTFSIAKTFVSACLGKAIEEGYVSSINDLVKDYIPELNYHKNFDVLTINQLLNQQSGIKENVNHLSHTNYGKIEKVLPKIEFGSAPGEKLDYVNTNYTLLGILIERATKKDLYQYFSERIWSKIGTCDSSVWGYDYQTHHTRAFSFFGGSTRDYAKFGKLYMQKGMWNGKQIIDSNWVKSTTACINPLGANVHYNSGWYIGEKEIGDYMALGMYRQQIYINPASDVVIICILKFDYRNLPLRWWELLRQITEQA
jgi:hypothetical protein